MSTISFYKGNFSSVSFSFKNFIQTLTRAETIESKNENLKMLINHKEFLEYFLRE